MNESLLRFLYPLSRLPYMLANLTCSTLSMLLTPATFMLQSVDYLYVFWNHPQSVLTCTWPLPCFVDSDLCSPVLFCLTANLPANFSFVLLSIIHLKTAPAFPVSVTMLVCLPALLTQWCHVAIFQPAAQWLTASMLQKVEWITKKRTSDMQI